MTTKTQATTPLQDGKGLAGKQPAKRWRNWYRAKTWARAYGIDYAPGGVMKAPVVHPSWEIAEHHALVKTPARCPQGFYNRWDWLGAYPEGSQP